MVYQLSLGTGEERRGVFESRCVPMATRNCSMTTVGPLSDSLRPTFLIRIVTTQLAVLVILLALCDRLRPRRATGLSLNVRAHIRACFQPSLVCIFPTHNPSTALTSPVVLPYISRKYIFHSCTGPACPHRSRTS